ncbi:MAG: hypothetical protein HC799_07495 [Limnothrix sp. RL_2_0]|nr:hypothetical protein [Limnothrix sp. RL_2_0]
MSQDLDQKAYYLYKLAKENPHDENLQLAANLVKSTRRSRGSLQSWNQRYREDINDLDALVQSKEEANMELQQELMVMNQELELLAQEKIRLVAQRKKAIAELKKIDDEVTVAVAQVKSKKTWFGKFSVLWSFMNTLFLDDEDMGEVDYSLQPDPDQPQLGSSIADVQKSLLDK